VVVGKRRLIEAREKVGIEFKMWSRGTFEALSPLEQALSSAAFDA